MAERRVDERTDVLKSALPRYGRLPSELIRSELSATAKVAYALLDDMTGPNGAPWPGLPYLAEALRTSESTARRALKELRDASWMTIEERPGHSNVYTCTGGPLSAMTGDPCQPRQGTPVTSDRGTPVTGDTRNQTKENEKKEPRAGARALQTPRRAVPEVDVAAEMRPRCSTCHRVCYTEDGSCVRCDSQYQIDETSALERGAERRHA